ncbi:MAG: hypothetical protein IPK83_19755 [Planctomycetes bacterium]|nr:hypothetical protein [Planctomycetota bacterium]
MSDCLGNESSALVMRALQGMVNSMSGKTVPITRETRIDRYFREVCGAESLEYLDITFQIEETFEIQLPREMWDYLADAKLGLTSEEWEAQYAPFFNFGRLADFIAHRVDYFKIEPVSMMGRPCLTAGAFRFMQETAHRVDPRVRRFGPSSAIRSHLSGKKSRRFWTIVRAASGNRIPRLKPPESTPSMYAFKSSIVLTPLIFICYSLIRWMYEINSLSIWPSQERKPDYGLGFQIFSFLVENGPRILLISLTIFTLTYLVQLIRSRKQPSSSIGPDKFVTFRDLADFIAGERFNKCRACGASFDNSVHGQCSNCGAAINVEDTNDSTIVA